MVVQLHHGIDFWVYRRGAEITDLGTRGVGLRLFLVSTLPLAISLLDLRIGERELRRWISGSATPRFWRNPGAVTRLNLAKLDVSRVGTKLLQQPVRLVGRGVVSPAPDKTAEAILRPIDSHAKAAIARDDLFDASDNLLILGGRLLAKQLAQQSANRDAFILIVDIGEEDVPRVENK